MDNIILPRYLMNIICNTAKYIGKIGTLLCRKMLLSITIYRI